MATEFDDRPGADEEGEELFYVGLYAATVVRNDDPEEIGRVKIKIPGLVEPESAWALPGATISGGIKGRGFYDPPDKGSDVLVMFIQGDLEQPAYFAGFWGVPDSGRETPGPDDGVGKDVRPQIKAYETARYLLMFDHRGGAEQLVIRDKVTNDQIDLKPSGINIKSAGTVNVEATGALNVKGSTVDLNGPGPGVARLGDAVLVTIPPGVVLVPSPLGPIPSPVPIPASGTIVSASVTVKAGSS